MPDATARKEAATRPETETLDANDAMGRALAETVLATPATDAREAPALSSDEVERAHGLHRVVLVVALANVVFLVQFCLHHLFAPEVPRSTLVEVAPISVARSGADWAGAIESVLTSARLPLVRAALEAITYLVGGLVLSRRRPSDPMLQLAVIGVLLMGVNTATVATLTTIPADAPATPWRVVAAILYTLAPVATFVILALYPSGRPVPPRLAPVCAALGVVPFFFFAWTMYAEHRFALAPLLVGMAAVAVMLGLQAYRYRHRATIRQRHQVKWLAYGATMFLALEVLTLAFVSPLVDPAQPSFALFALLREALLFAAYLVPFLSMVFSAAQLRLWDVDRLINRSLVYATLTAALGAVFVVVFFAVRALVVGVLGQSVVAGALAGGIVVALALVPTRRVVSRWIDRTFFGIGLDYEELARRAATQGSLPVEGDTFASFVHLQLLGRGGMGAVYKASHPAYDFAVVLKVLSRELATKGYARERFRREARILEQIDHPNVVPFLDRGDDYLVMTHVEGRDLADRLAREGRVPLPEAIAILRDLASALDAIHAKGFVHRDVKPANVLVGPERAMLLDFGVAREIATPAQTEDVVGTLAYIAPEQVHDPRNVDGRADLYSLAVTAFEMLTGQLPFTDPSPLALAMSHLHVPPPLARSIAPELPAHVEAALDRALSKSPAERPAKASDFVRALEGRAHE
jgi:predicted Ser/Thr protein kinase